MTHAIRRYDSIDSTNEEARRLAAAGETGPLWLIARAQTKGRGRRGNVWVSDAGNLFASWLMQPGKPPAMSMQLGFAAGLAVADTLSAYAPGVTLKWPNDVLLNGRKIAGVLLEAAGNALIVGIGINLKHAPEGTEFPAISLQDVAAPAPDAEEVLHRLAARMDAWYAVWLTSGFAPLRDAWLARAAQLGGALRARLHEGEMQGIFEGLDTDGALLLRASGAVTRITAGEVYF